MRFVSIAAIAACVALISANAVARPAVDRDIRKYVCERLDDFTANVVVVKADQRALGKISKDMGLAYKIPNTVVRYKEPNRVRMEGSSEGSRITYIINGAKEWFMLNGRKVTERDHGDSPGKRKSLMDVGLVSEAYLSYSNAEFKRETTVDGTPCAVFDMTYKDRDEDTSHHIVYIDPATKVVRKRESYSQTGKLQAIYYYKNVEQVKPGIWFPTQIEAHNTDREVAGIMAYRNVKVNTSIPESVFRP